MAGHKNIVLLFYYYCFYDYILLNLGTWVKKRCIAPDEHVSTLHISLYIGVWMGKCGKLVN